MANNYMTVDTQHSDMIHDAQFDYYGTLLATCSSDEKIKVYKLLKQPVLFTEISEHHGPVWRVAWAHPIFGTILASCSYDSIVKIFSIEPDGSYTTLYSYENHKSSVNSISWAPREFGLCLACASSDGSVSIISRKDDQVWQSKVISVSTVGCNSISFAPYRHIGSEESNNIYMRIAVGCSDACIYIYKCKAEGGEWELDTKLIGHSDWVRDVVWSPYTGVPYNLIASCGKDNKLYIWSQKANEEWVSTLIKTFDTNLWRASWSLTGNLLSVTSGTQEVTIWKESFEGKWEVISDSLVEN
ncbi:hypothetical protein WA158_007180 [Blastocystis sp. Blastoise]